MGTKSPNMRFVIPSGEIKRLGDMLSEFSRKDAAAILRKGLDISAKKHIVKMAKAKVRKRSGNLRKSLRTRYPVYRRRKIFGVDVYAKRGPKHPGGYYAHLIEYGHRIVRVRRGKKYVLRGKTVPAYPFLGPSLRQSRQAVIRDLAQYTKVAAERWNKRQAKKRAKATMR